MIARNKPELKEKTKVLLLVPYFGHATVKGLLTDIDRSQSSIFTYLFNENPEEEVNPRSLGVPATEYVSQYQEAKSSFRISPEKERSYLRDLLGIVRAEEIDVIIPTKEKLVSLLARNKDCFKKKLLLPSLNIVRLLQSKANTYDFFQRKGIQTPQFSRVNPQDHLKLRRILGKKGPQFVKPDSDSGGKGAYLIKSVEDYIERYDNFKGKLISSEVLNLPEYNHTFIVRAGSIQVQATYQCPGSTQLGTSPREIFYDPKISELAEKIHQILKSKYGSKATEGVYNADFLTDSNENYVLSEINVGRLPGGHSIFKGKGLNLSDALIKNTLDNQQSILSAA